MEILKPLTDFSAAIRKDYRISITHLGIYSALLIYRAAKGFINPIHVFSYEIMGIANISDTTYHKRVKELHEYGYIIYEPSVRNNEASSIYFVI